MAGPSPAAFFENTSLAFKYLHGEFENDDERDQCAAQLTVEFQSDTCLPLKPRAFSFRRAQTRALFEHGEGPSCSLISLYHGGIDLAS